MERFNLKPEEKLAARLLDRHNLIPPYDLHALAGRYSKIEYLSLPGDADGVVINPKIGTPPEILINSKKNKNKATFHFSSRVRPYNHSMAYGKHRIPY